MRKKQYLRKSIIKNTNCFLESSNNTEQNCVSKEQLEPNNSDHPVTDILKKSHMTDPANQKTESNTGSSESNNEIPTNKTDQGEQLVDIENSAKQTKFLKHKNKTKSDVVVLKKNLEFDNSTEMKPKKSAPKGGKRKKLESQSKIIIRRTKSQKESQQINKEKKENFKGNKSKSRMTNIKGKRRAVDQVRSVKKHKLNDVHQYDNVDDKNLSCVCDVCGKSFVEKQKLSEHYKEHKGIHSNKFLSGYERFS